jgi:hypothetical protein
MLALLGLEPALAADAKPSEQSVRRLFEAMHTSQMIDSVMQQTDANLREALERAAGGRTLNAAQQKLHDDMRAKIEAMLKEELAWSRLEPQMVEVYRSTFTPAEIESMLGFYDSPSGRAVVAKLPQATQQMMQLTQEHVGALIPRIVELQKETAQKIKDAATASSTVPAPGAPPSPPSPRTPPSPQAPPPPH